MSKVKSEQKKTKSRNPEKKGNKRVVEARGLAEKTREGG